MKAQYVTCGTRDHWKESMQIVVEFLFASRRMISPIGERTRVHACSFRGVLASHPFPGTAATGHPAPREAPGTSERVLYFSPSRCSAPPANTQLFSLRVYKCVCWCWCIPWPMAGEHSLAAASSPPFFDPDDNVTFERSLPFDAKRSPLLPGTLPAWPSVYFVAVLCGFATASRIYCRTISWYSIFFHPFATEKSY